MLLLIFKYTKQYTCSALRVSVRQKKSRRSSGFTYFKFSVSKSKRSLGWISNPLVSSSMVEI